MALTISQYALDEAVKLNNEAKSLVDAGKQLEAEAKVADACYLVISSGF